MSTVKLPILHASGKAESGGVGIDSGCQHNDRGSSHGGDFCSFFRCSSKFIPSWYNYVVA